MSQIKIVDHPDLLPSRIEPISIRNLAVSYPHLRPVVIDGVLRQGETANIIAAAKVGKSFSAGGLAWCIATGMPWFNHPVTKGKVLVIDNELHPETLVSRMTRIANELKISVDEFGDMIDVIPIRGQSVDINAIESRLSEIEPGTYTIAILDALYRTLPAGMSENDNAAMMSIYNRLDYYASQWNCSIVVVHHASKGAQGDKAVTDVGSGAGSISRAADTHIVIRPHEEEGLSVMECVTRSFKSPEPISIRFDWPLWSIVDSEPVVKKATRQNTEAQAETDRKDSEAILQAMPEKAIQQSRLREQLGFGVGKFDRLIGAMIRDRKVKISRKRKKGGQRSLVFYSKVVPNSNNDFQGDFDAFQQ